MRNFIEQNGNQRTAFCEKHFKDCVFDLQIFNFADLLMPGYDGGYWNYMIDEKSGTPFFVLSSNEEQVVLRNFSGENFKMNINLAGMIITFFALTHRIEKTQDDDLMPLWDDLKDTLYDYAEELNQFNEAFKMID
jgi:hypothetical protein